MAKKPSRKQRKVIRERHQRAQAHGLPARALERPSRPSPASWDAEYSKRRSEDEEDEDAEPGDSISTAPPKPRTLLERLKGLPVGAKLAAAAVLVVLVIGLIATLRRQ